MKVIRFILQCVLVFIFVILGVTIVPPLLVTMIIYEKVFGSRCTVMKKIVSNEDYPDLNKKDISFKSGKNLLRGGVFTSKQHNDKRALIILGHGIGCGMNNYLNRIDYFTRKGYVVLSYDITGCCASEGKSMRGLPQSQIDMYEAIKFVKRSPEFNGLDILIYGHSWSGYASACVLNHKDIKDNIVAVASMSGFNDSWGIIRTQGGKYIGKVIKLIKPFAYLYQLLKFGKNVFYTGISGINEFDKPVLVMHSDDDPTVPFRDSIIYAKDKCTNKNAKFILCEGRGHTMSRPIASEARINANFHSDETRITRDKMNIFQYNVEVHYDKSEISDIYGIDEKFMDEVNEFFLDALDKKHKALTKKSI